MTTSTKTRHGQVGTALATTGAGGSVYMQTTTCIGNHLYRPTEQYSGGH
ncbi:MAG: hypothetical protein K0U66_06285 [Gammaproteobacteria bacterium]|nr:hypothetical protein [Gammaproteobacteria bacterium]